MTLIKERVTVEAFDVFIQQPENADQRYELIDGEIIEVTSNSYSSMLAMLIGAFITAHVFQHQLGWVTGADGGYLVGDDRHLPDVGYISKARHPEAPKSTYIPMPPDLAVEVLSPTDNIRHVLHKVFNYAAAGVTVWVVYPTEQAIEIYAPGQPPQIFGKDKVIDGGTLLPGFSLPLKDVFRD